VRIRVGEHTHLAGMAARVGRPNGCRSFYIMVDTRRVHVYILYRGYVQYAHTHTHTHTHTAAHAAHG